MENRSSGRPDDTLTGIRDYLLECGACCVGFADVSDVPDLVDDGYTRAVCIGLALRPEPIVQLRERGERPAEAEAPTRAALRELAGIAVRYLRRFGASAALLDQENAPDDIDAESLAVRCGIAWIGKSSRPVTWDFGSAIRLVAVLTDADLPPDDPTGSSFCGTCLACTRACVVHAPKGVTWEPGMKLSDFVDSEACSKRRRELQEKGLDCRFCMSVCPFTLVYLSNCGIDLPPDAEDT